ncbi:callose synthase 1 [Brassica napus]|uniref:callose synthase 1 n=1 Tax=Brassica napus TaxID=3708 RepID=UPI0020786591|nr:callose synthase 1 [Brassica napus]
MQNFYLEYYEKNIQALFKFLEDNRYFEGYGPGPMPLWPTPTDGLQPSRTLSVRADRALLLTNACRAALALYKVVEHLSKDVQLPPQILEAHSEVKRLAQIFRPYNHIPNDPYSDDHPMRRLPAMRAVEAALGVKVYSRDNCT